LCLINKKNILQNFHCILLFYFTQEVQTWLLIMRKQGFI
jgi:hypothetical protein